MESEKRCLTRDYFSKERGEGRATTRTHNIRRTTERNATYT